ncbi:cytochrome P450 [Dichomitus squalens LYAD-421 SS1]|uniref:Cytochrome P450 n=1 Tax=Dichomitus squalens (strain LYAD-421) TaxID=732165 RepID=R7T0Z5_DICSQ|nr:cytochrome P450 [Dichomitus squalens LYAD-421 SS1]EJF60847.1 cytochrome P450 [Dichomitus squalens LYAD-421 SS1]
MAILQSLSLPPFILGIFGTLCYLYWRFIRSESALGRYERLPLPPGPPGFPVIGNLLDYPKDRPWLAYKELSKKYGDIVSLRIFSQQLIILNDYNTAIDLLDKRSSIYSSRPPTPMFRLTGWDWALGMMPYGPWWRRHRRAFWQEFHSDVVGRYHSNQEESARRLLARLLKSPQHFTEHIEYSVGAAIIESCYGLPVAEEDDKYIALFKETASTINLTTPGSSMILESFPVLARTPTWLPGTSFLRRLARTRQMTADMRDIPWKDLQEAMNTTGIKVSAASSMMDRFSNISGGSTSDDEDIARNVVATHSATVAFVIAMALYPDVQAKAQAELEHVCGKSRLPEMADMDSLPYIQAIMREVLRWHAIAPLSLPHVAIADDEYNGYFIPKGSLIIANAWAFLQDPEVYPEPDRFMPERFLKDGKFVVDIRDPATIAFGFGRRICPGRHFATSALFIFIASILHTFAIKSPLDEHGLPIRSELRQTTGLISFLEGCDCKITPRSEWAEALIRS